MSASSPTPLGYLVGRNVRALREEYGWPQDRLTGALRAHGLPWTRSALTKLENGDVAGQDERVIHPCARA